MVESGHALSGSCISYVLVPFLMSGTVPAVVERELWLMLFTTAAAHTLDVWNKNIFPLTFCTGGVGNVYKTFLLFFHKKQTTESDRDRH